MMLFLILNIFHNLINLGMGIGKRTVTFLPGEATTTNSQLLRSFYLLFWKQISR